MWSLPNGPLKLRHTNVVYLVFSVMVNLVLAANEIWPDGLDRPAELPTVSTFDVMCGKDHMDIQIRFTGPFNGIVSSKGHINDPNCLYVPPLSGKSFYTIRVPYARCGTKPDLHGQFYENTVVIQYDKDLMEAWDEPKRLRCEWFNEYEKTASKPPMVIADLDVIQLDFRGDNVDCWMEIQSGKGPWSQPVSGIVPIGSTLTLVVAINDYRGEFDMRVKSCVASDGLDHVINLSDEFGCVLRPKMISRFVKARAPNDKATVITYAFFHAFKFPDALSVHINCKVEICRHGCMDHCQPVASNKRHDIVEQKLIETNAIERPEINRSDGTPDPDANDPDNDISDDGSGGGSGMIDDDTSFYEEFADAVGLNTKTSPKDIEKVPQTVEKQKPKPKLKPEQKPSVQLIQSEPDLPPIRVHVEQPSKSAYEVHEDFVDSFPPNQNLPMHDMLHRPQVNSNRVNIDKFPHGPRSFNIERMGLLLPPPRSFQPARPAPKKGRTTTRSMADHGVRPKNLGKKIRQTLRSGDRFVVVNRPKRYRRSISVSDGQSQSADIGVVGVFDVVSEADLAFSPHDGKPKTETVLQGKIAEEILNGICMPMPVFSVLFILVILTAVILVLTVGSLYYRYQVHKDMVEKQTNSNNINPNSLGSWITLRLFRMNDGEMQPCDPVTGIIPESST